MELTGKQLDRKEGKSKWTEIKWDEIKRLGGKQSRGQGVAFGERKKQWRQANESHEMER